ncbi:MAG: hypothetical protein IKN17_08690 [Ruminococcus sp.]|nr:hypothetical protein [Ruminococcus sp.]
MRSYRTMLAACAAALMLASCGAAESSGEAIPAPQTVQTTVTEAQTEAPAEPAATTPEVTEAAVTTAEEQTAPEESASEESTPEETEPSAQSGPSPDKYEINAYGQKMYKFSEKYEQFVNRLTFVGDSICYGLEVYDYLPPDNVLAFGSVAARNIFDFTFDVSDVEYTITDAVKQVDPDILIFSMGMNDINLTTPEQYCENYMYLLDQVHQAVPSAKLYVASITPISNGIEFNNNTNIDLFNSTIKQYLADSGKGYGYVDIATYLKDQWNGLAYEYSGGDGIHLQSPAYSAILYQVCEQLCD